MMGLMHSTKFPKNQKPGTRDAKLLPDAVLWKHKATGTRGGCAGRSLVPEQHRDQTVGLRGKIRGLVACSKAGRHRV